MRSSIDRRVVPEDALRLIRACQRRVPCHLAGGAALSGAHLSHRLSRDVDLFCHRREEVRLLVDALPEVARETGVQVQILRDAGTFVRCQLALPSGDELEMDIVFDSTADIEPPPPPIDEITIESLADLRAAKLTCLLSRSEPRDLVDLLFLDRAGFPPERDLELALQKDAGMDPGVLAWLLGQFPTSPLPLMLQPLSEAELRAFRDELRERLRAVAVQDRPG